MTVYEASVKSRSTDGKPLQFAPSVLSSPTWRRAEQVRRRIEGQMLVLDVYEVIGNFYPAGAGVTRVYLVPVGANN